ncbi:MAG: hypothetical protein QOH76_2785 [Thermoleophilaceae bacterium]|jgi:hypothetical protein|nr:hypothetical protein [Thermoleophilaceae bacterium]
MADRNRESQRDAENKSRNEQRYDDLARQNREGHRQVQRSLKEAERIANGTRHSATPA